MIGSYRPPSTVRSLLLPGARGDAMDAPRRLWGVLLFPGTNFRRNWSGCSAERRLAVVTLCRTSSAVSTCVQKNIRDLKTANKWIFEEAPTHSCEEK